MPFHHYFSLSAWRSRLPFSGLCLLAILQRAPADIAAGDLQSAPAAGAAAAVLRSMAIALSALGSVHTLAGASVLSRLVTSTGSPLRVNMNQPITPVAFGVTGTQTPAAAWQVIGGLPPGLSFSGLGAPGVVNVANPILSGTPTSAGTFNLNLMAWQLAGGTGTQSPTFSFQVIVASVLAPPLFTTQPANTSILAGQTISMVAVANGATAMQWFKDGAAVPGATANFITFSNAQASDAGTYVALAINAAGSTSSSPAVLTVTGPPIFTEQPASQTISSPGTVVFNSAASRGAAYQWRFNGVSLPGATAARLVISPATTANAGTYSVAATTAAGSALSNAATLSVAATNDPGRLINLSVMTMAGNGGIITLGFVTGGDHAVVGQNLLLRGIGPTLATFGVPSPLTDPSLMLFASGTPVGANDNWGTNQAAVMAANRATGAFALPNVASLDAAMVSVLPAGAYSAQIAGNGPGAGLALAEVYDNTPAGTYVPNMARLVNLSCLTQVAPAGALTAGFVIGGATAKTVLIRAIGPALASFGVPSIMADPQLALFDGGGNRIESNSSWGGDAQVTAAAAAVHAFLIADTASHDAVLLTTLAPGSYTAQVTSSSGAGGAALVEAYEVP
jgi:hypothetical protein